MLRKGTYDCIRRGYTPEVLREIRGLRYFDDAEVQYYCKALEEWFFACKGAKVVNLTEVRRVIIGLIAVEVTMKERLREKK